MTTTPEEQCAELRREIATRRRIYPRWVEDGKLTEGQAAFRLAALEDVLERLEALSLTHDAQLPLL